MSAPDYQVFAHLQAEKADLYRRVLKVFVSERDRFVISLRRSEIHAIIVAAGETPPSDGEIDQALQQLNSWGNLDDTPDNADPATIEEFYQRRRLYQLSAAGEAAERALGVFDEYLHRPGELQSTTLREIAELLDAIMPRLADRPLDDSKLHHLVRKHRSWLTDWFAHHADWSLVATAEAVRLRKHPPDNADGTRGAVDQRSEELFTRTRYVLLCLALAALERGDRHVTLARLSEAITLGLASDAVLGAAGIHWTLDQQAARSSRSLCSRSVSPLEFVTASSFSSP